MKGKYYVTFHTDKLPKKIYYVAQCDSEEMARNVVDNIAALDGVKYPRISQHININGRKQINMNLWDNNNNTFKNYNWYE